MGRIVDLEAVRAARKSFCAVCGSHYGLQVHHIVPRSRCGGDVPGNLEKLRESERLRAINRKQ